MSQQPLEYRASRPRPFGLVALVLTILQISAAAMVLIFGMLFWWALLATILEMWRHPPPLYDIYDRFRTCMYSAPPFALGGILFVLCRLRSGVDRAET